MLRLLVSPFTALLLLATCSFVYANDDQYNAHVSVCFVPDEKCDDQIVKAIQSANTEIRILAYHFTYTKILRSIRDAVSRGVKVFAVIDRVNVQKRYQSATYLSLAGASVWIDTSVAIAHNKIIIIDRHLVIGGSFNYSKAAQDRNAENVTFTIGEEVTMEYLSYWESRRKVSEPFVVPK